MTLECKNQFTFPKAVRLLSPRQFRRVTKYGKVVSGEFVAIHVCESRKSSLKLGLTVSRKYGGAVQRNRFKRLMREAFRLSQHALPPYLHLNVRPTPKAATATLASLQHELLTLLNH